MTQPPLVDLEQGLVHRNSPSQTEAELPAPKKAHSWMGESIIVSIVSCCCCCSLPLSLLAISYSSKVDELWNLGKKG